MSEQPSTSPPPPVEGAMTSPMTVAVNFVKTYYKTLSTTPEQCFKFYKPHSYLSHGEGNTPSTAKGFETYELADRWGSTELRFDFDSGAIDAQPSANGSILLVATGHVVMKIDGNEERKAFIHTFFLACQELPNKRKSYYVHNDILRFLKDGQQPASSESSGAEAVTKSEKEDTPAEEPVVVEEKPEEPEPKEASPGGGVEETKEVAPAEEEPEPKEPVAEKKSEKPKEEPATPAKETSAPAAEEKKEKPAKETESSGNKEGGSSSEGGKKSRRQRGRGKSPAQQNAPKQQPASKPVPGSWASLVASGSGPTAASPAPAPTPSKAAAPEKQEAEKKKEQKKAEPKEEKKAETSNAKENGKGGKDRPKRDPDNTLVIKNLAENTKDAELLAIFEKFAIQTKSKIVSSTISSHRGLAFVDYDSVAPVMAAVEQHGKEPIQLNGRVLEVDQKTAEQRARKMRGGGYRSGSPKDFNRGGGSGRQNKRDRGGGGGNRGGNKGNRGGGR